MSARQLELHYLIYRAWQALLNADTKQVNVGQSSDVQSRHVVMAGLELSSRKLPYDRDLTVLHRLGLVNQYKYDMHRFGEKAMPFLDVTPTTFGVMLFAVAHNKIDTWRDFPKEQYQSAAGIKPVALFADNLEKLCIAAGIPFKTEA